MLRTGNMPGKYHTKYPILPRYDVYSKLHDMQRALAQLRLDVDKLALLRESDDDELRAVGDRVLTMLEELERAEAEARAEQDEHQRTSDANNRDRAGDDDDEDVLTTTTAPPRT